MKRLSSGANTLAVPNATLYISSPGFLCPTSKEYIQRYINAGRKLKNVETNFSYNSETNSTFLTVDQIRSLINANLN